MTDFKQLLSDYLRLSYTGEDIRCEGYFRDMLIDDYIILRQSEEGVRIIYLFSGASLYIPKPWLLIFHGLYKHSGDEILYRRQENWDEIDRAGLSFLDLCTYLDLSTLNGPELLKVLSDITGSKTKKLREWLETEFDLELPDLEFTTLTLIKDI